MFKIDIGSRLYSVVVRSQLTDAAGGECFAQLDADHGRMLISEACPASMRLEAICDMAFRALLMRVPAPQSTADLATLFSTAAACVIRSLERQGGTLTLKMMHSGSGDRMTLADLDDSLSGNAGDVLRQCGPDCGQRWSSGMVAVGSKPRRERGVMVIDLACLCGDGCTFGCGRLVRWTEMVNESGRPTGVQVGEATYLTGDEVAEFRRLHPDKCC